jgi:hypothetical protein
MQEADGHSLHTESVQLVSDALDFFQAERSEDTSIRSQPLCELEPSFARHKWLGEPEEKVVELVTTLATDLQNISETAGRQKSRFRSFALDKSIRHERRRMGYVSDVLDRDLMAGNKFAEPVEDAELGPRDIRQALGCVHPAFHRINDHDVGESATDVGAENEQPRSARLARFLTRL